MPLVAFLAISMLMLSLRRLPPCHTICHNVAAAIFASHVIFAVYAITIADAIIR